MELLSVRPQREMQTEIDAGNKTETREREKLKGKLRMTEMYAENKKWHDLNYLR